MKELEKELRKLCIDFISIMDNLKENGFITEAEYIQHTSLKNQFLSCLDNGSNEKDDRLMS